MAYIEKNLPPPNKIYTFSLKNFNGGLNNRSDQIEDNQASDLLNMDFADDTLMEKRRGQKYFDDLCLTDVEGATDDVAVVFIDEYKPHNDDAVLIRASKNYMYIEDEVLTDIKGKPQGVNHNGRYIFVDGEKIYCYGWFHQSNTTYRKISGTPINDYVLLEVVSPPADFTPLSSEHVEGVLHVDYDKYEIWYEPCQNELDDAYKGANVVPQNVSYIVSHNGRVYLAGADEDDDNVFISDINNPFYYPVALPIQVPPNSDKIVALAVYDNSIVVGRTQDVHVIFGNTNRPDMGVETFNLRRINTHTGFASHDSVVIAHNYLFFLGSDGNAYSLGSTRIDEKQLSTNIISRTIDLFKHPINLTKDDLLNATSIFHDDRWYVSINDKVLVYSYRHMAWTMFNNFNATSFYVLDNKLIWGRSDGKTATFDDENYMDFGVPYKAFWHSKYFDMNEANTFKQFREFYVVAHTFKDNDSLINLVFEIDYQDVKERVVIENTLSVWGKSKWGDRWVNRIINESIPFQIGRRGRNIRFKFSNGYFPDGEVETKEDLADYVGRIEGVLVYVIEEEKFYLYTNKEWVLMSEDDLNQRMKIHQINGEYELRGKR